MQTEPFHCNIKHELAGNHSQSERHTVYVLILTAVTMVAEIVAGTLSGSMALLADGWHMGTHVAAFMITLFAYRYARKHADSPAYSFGTGKVNVLGGFASAIALAVVALLMLIESVERLLQPHTIHFNEAIAVATLGLLVNLLSALLLKDSHHHDHHDHSHPHDHAHHHEDDHNLQAAYMHVLADALTSVLAITALFAGKYAGWHWMDPLMGIVGAIIITRWGYGLIKQTSPILLDASMDETQLHDIRRRLEAENTRVLDLHVWRISASHYAAVICLYAPEPQPAEHYRQLLQHVPQLSHITFEIHQ